MKRWFAIVCLGLFLSAGSVAAMDHSAHMDKSGAEMQGGMDHSKMEHGASHENGTFKYSAMVDGIHAEFQVMDLASMNMKDEEGRTHHVMVSFTKDGSKITQAVGKVKLISPSQKEQIGTLKNFGSGMFAANFTIDEEGKWGVICLFKDDSGQQHTVKFWYPHMTM